MKSSLLPDRLLRLMDPVQRRSMGRAGMTATERCSAAQVRLERDLHRLIGQELNRRGVFALHNRMDRASTVAVGAPDFCFVIGGHPFAIEVKLPGQHLRPEQEQVRHQMHENGWDYRVVHSFDEFAWVIKPGAP